MEEKEVEYEQGDKEVTEDIQNAYMNDQDGEIVISDYFYTDDKEKICVIFKTKYTDDIHKEYFNAPKNGSLTDCDEFQKLLEEVNISPLNINEIVGESVPASYNGREWTLDMNLSESQQESKKQGIIEEKKPILLFCALVLGELAIIFFTVLLLA